LWLPGSGPALAPVRAALGRRRRQRPLLQQADAAGPAGLDHRRGLLLGGFRQAEAHSRQTPDGREAGYDFVRRGIVYETIGKKEGEKYVPFAVSLFFFIWMMNLWSIIPVAAFPVTSIIAYPAILALLVYITWVSLTFKRHGFVGAFKNFTGYDKSLGPVLPLAMTIEFFSNLVVRPFTHAVRLFANMFAGHTLLLLFTIASWYMLNGIGIAYSAVSFVMVIVMTAFELFIQAVQAYVFVLLTCTFIQGALAEHH
jgi:F-type H+-transporting ATPase subunit a